MMPDIRNKVMLWAHNVFLEFGAKTGIPSLIFFIFVIFYALKDIRGGQRIFKHKGDMFLLTVSQALEVSILGYLVFAM